MKQLDLFAPTAQDWIDQMTVHVRAHVAVHGMITPDDVQDVCNCHRLHPPQSGYHGVLWDHLRRLGLERTLEEQMSRVRSNNGRKVRIWRPGPQWGSAS